MTDIDIESLRCEIEQQKDRLLQKLIDTACENRAMIDGLINWGNALAKSLEETQTLLLTLTLNDKAEHERLKKRLFKIRVPEEFSLTIGSIIDDVGSLQSDFKHHREVEHRPKQKVTTSSYKSIK